jgi:hypothetical protein
LEILLIGRMEFASFQLLHMEFLFDERWMVAVDKERRTPRWRFIVLSGKLLDGSFLLDRPGETFASVAFKTV